MPTFIFLFLALSAWSGDANALPSSNNCLHTWARIHNSTTERCGDVPLCWQSVFNVLEKKKSYDDCLSCLKYIVEGRSGQRPMRAKYFIDHFLCMRKKTDREQRACADGDEESRSLGPLLRKLLADFRTPAHDVCNTVSACLPEDRLTLQELTDFRIYFGEYYSPDEPLDECWPVIEHFFHGNRIERARRDATRIPAKCLAGTKVWCSSEEMARRCNRFKYCKWKIWDRDCKPEKKCYKNVKSDQ